MSEMSGKASGEGESLLRPGQQRPTWLNKLLTPEALKLIMWMVIFICAGVGNAVALKYLQSSFINYPYFVNQLTTFAYIPVFGAIIIYLLKFTKNITPEMRAFPQKKFLYMGSFDACAGYLIGFGGAHTSGPIQQLCNQAIIPTTMILSYSFLKARYNLIQSFGAAVILTGVVVTLIPTFTSKGSSDNLIFSNLLFLISNIPNAGSNVYKEIAFKTEVDLDVWYLSFWVCVWQMIIGIVLMPLNAIIPIEYGGTPFSQIPSSLSNGALCFGGHNSITVAPTPDIYLDDCNNAWLHFCIYITFNIVYNVAILQVIRVGSSTILSICSTVRLPLTNLSFSMPFMDPKIRKSFTKYDTTGLLVILGGVLGYRYGSVMASKKAKAEGGDDESEGTIQPVLSLSAGSALSEVYEPVRVKKVLRNRPVAQVRADYLLRLGINRNGGPRFGNGGASPTPIISSGSATYRPIDGSNMA